ncbi:MAG: ABC transporter permease [Clostridiales bacterium]|nr:ABC transporter permease [Clostridiales bacterium]
MFILKNAMRNIVRAKGRSILIGIIITIIALSVCIGLCIRQSAASSKESALSDMTITAQISMDRDKAMSKSSSSSGSISKSKLKSAMKNSSLSLTQLKKYAKASAVKSFYYTLSASVDASGSLEAYSTSSSSNSSSTSSSNSDSKAPSGMTTGDFTITGYSSDEAMTDFVDGTCKIKSGKMFDEGTSAMVCVISSDLAKYNDLSVGDYIKVANPNKSSETYKLKIVGIYKNSQSSTQATMGGPGQQTDPANEIYTSYNTLKKITDTSAAKYSSSSTTAISGNLNGTYVVGTVANYKKFKTQVSDLGLSSKYAVSSTDIESYERSAEPLENLSKFAGYFLIVILLVGAIILVVMNIFSTRERKYEIGVLSAIGMKKSKIAKLFMSEIMIIALVAVVIGGTIGTVASVPVTNALLSSQITQSQTKSNDMQQSFGRDNNGAGPSQPSDNSSSSSSNSSGSSSSSASGNSDSNKGAVSNYISSVSNSVNIIVLLELLGSCILLAIIAGMVSVISIMRYEPLQILANRD